MMLFVLMLLPIVAFAGFCSDKPDGSYNAGCRSYTQCSGGVATIVDCENDLVFNSNTGSCDSRANVPPPCNLWRDCNHQENKRYPEMQDSCESYYTCLNNIYLGHNPCPQGLVFNDEDQLCDWKWDTVPPCGTKV